MVGTTNKTEVVHLSGRRIIAARPSQLEDCCLIVATYCRSSDVRELLLRLVEMQDVPAEVVFVDASPDQNTERAILELSQPLPFDLIYLRSPKGLTRQRNIGICVTTKPILFFLDDDALPMPGYFAEVRRVFTEDTHHEIGAIGVCANNEMDKKIPLRWRIRHALRIVPRTAPFVYNDVGTSAPSGLLKPFDGIRDVDLFPGYAFAARRSILDLHRFSEFFDGYSYGEDVEMSLRIRQTSRVVSCGTAKVIHKVSPGGRPPAFNKGRMEVINRYFIWKRYSPDASLINRVRFYSDLLLLFIIDAGWFITRPWKWQYVSHAFGLLCGIAQRTVQVRQWNENGSTGQYCFELLTHP